MAPARPDAAQIATHTRSLIATGQVRRETALEGLELLANDVRSKYRFTDEELQPILELISELGRDRRQ
jgi:hypothetical protein